MAVRPSEPLFGTGATTCAKTFLAAIAVAGGVLRSPALSAPNGWDSDATQSVLVQSQPGPAADRPLTRGRAGAARQAGPAGMPGARIISDRAVSEPFQFASQQPVEDAGIPAEAVPLSPAEAVQLPPDGMPVHEYGGPEGGYASDLDGAEPSSTEAGFGDDPGLMGCGNPACPGDCPICQAGGHGNAAWRFNAACEPQGLLQKLLGMCHRVDDAGLWTGRADALILARNAPGFRPLYNTTAGANALNANQLESIVAVGPRLSLFRRDMRGCNNAWEGTYFYTGSFVSQRTLSPALPPAQPLYDLAPPGIYGVVTPNPEGGLDSASARLIGSLQSAEVNRRWGLGSCAQMLAGFRWIQWQESLSISDSYGAGTENFGQDFYNTVCVNDLYGGQIGLDTLLWQPASCFRVEGLLKAGAYYNNAVQNSLLVQPAAGYSSAVGVGESPATCSFVGELGVTGVVPICSNWDFRLGYFGLWLTSIAQPVNQLSGQQLVQGVTPNGTLTTNGAVVLQGLSLGLEGRW